MNIYGLDAEVIDSAAVERTAQRFREQQIVLPTFAELATPGSAPGKMHARLGEVDKDAASAANLWRIHWYNALDGTLAPLPEHVVLTRELTGVEAPIVVAFGNRFPMIGAHKVLAAYACLAPRLVTGTFDPTHHRAIWPSTGNYCRGGVAVSRVMGCRGVAVLPEGMSRERFDWLERLGRRRERHHKDAGNREQREGDLRPLPRARRGPGQRHLEPVLRVREPPRPPSGDGLGARACRRASRGRPIRTSNSERSCPPPVRQARSAPVTT